MAAPGIETFLATLRKSNLLSKPQWQQLTDRIADRAGRGMPSVEELSTVLIRDGWLTAWQIEHLKAGRHSFFLGRYKLLEQIGSGGMGAVFRAEQVGLNRIVALKLLSQELGRDPAALKRFHQEIQAVAAVDHPNVVTAFDADAVGETHFLVMQYVAGKSLAEMLLERGPAPVNWACECIRQVAEGLQHAWERGLVHRDIKPSNLLVIPEAAGSSANLIPGAPATGLTIKILDLGLARVVSEQGDDQGLTHTGQVLGTPDYISPEQATDTRKADIRSDLFSLGVTFHRLLTGELPYSGTSVMEKLMARATQPAPSVRTVRPDVSEEVARIVLRLLEKDPARRFQTPRELARALGPFCKNAATGDWIRRDFERAPERVAAEASANEPSTVVDQILARIATAAPAEVGDLDLSAAPAFEKLVSPSSLESKGQRQRRPLGKRPGNGLRPRQISVLKARTLAFGAILLAGLAGLSWWLGGMGSPRPARLVVDWPLSLRQGALLLINGKEMSFGPEAEVVWEGTPGPCRLRAVRPGFPAIDAKVELKSGRSEKWSPDWAGAEQVWFDEMVARIDSQKTRLKSAPAASTAATRELMLGVLDRAPRNAAGQQLARNLGAVRWPLDELGPIELTAEQGQLLGKPTVDGAAVGAESRQILALFGDPRWRHAGEILATGIGAATESIVTAGADGFVRIWGFDGRLRGEHPYQSRNTRVVVSSRGDHALVLGGAAALLLALPGGNSVASYPGVMEVGGFSGAGSHFVVAHQAEGISVVAVARPTTVRWLPSSAITQISRLVLNQDGTLVAIERGRSTAILRSTGAEVSLADSASVNRPVWHAERNLLALQVASGDATVLDFSVDPPSTALLEDAGEPLGFASRGTMLMTRRNQRATLWDLATAREVRTLQDIVGTAAVVSDPPAIVTGDESFGWLRLRPFTRSGDLSIPAHVGPLSALTISDDGRWIGSGGSDGRLRVWNAETLAERIASEAGVVAASLTPDGRQILLGTDDGTLRVWDVATRQMSRTLVTGARDIREIVISPGGRFIASIGDWGFFRVTPRVWEAATGTEVALAGDPVSGARTMRFTGGGDRLVILTERGLVTTWSLPEGLLADQHDLASIGATDLAVEPRETFAAVLGNRELAIWSQRESIQARTVPPGATHVQLSPWNEDVWLLSSKQLFVSTFKRNASWDRQQEIPPGSASWSFDLPHERVALGAENGPVEILTLNSTWSGPAPSGVLKRDWKIPGRGPVKSLQFSCEGRHLLIVGSGGVATLMRLEEFESRERREID